MAVASCAGDAASLTLPWGSVKGLHPAATALLQQHATPVLIASVGVAVVSAARFAWSAAWDCCLSARAWATLVNPDLMRRTPPLLPPWLDPEFTQASRSFVPVAAQDPSSQQAAMAPSLRFLAACRLGLVRGPTSYSVDAEPRFALRSSLLGGEEMLADREQMAGQSPPSAAYPGVPRLAERLATVQESDEASTARSSSDGDWASSGDEDA